MISGFIRSGPVKQFVKILCGKNAIQQFYGILLMRQFLIPSVQIIYRFVYTFSGHFICMNDPYDIRHIVFILS